MIDKVESKIVIILDKYEITERCTEIALIDENQTEKYLKMFLINKRVAGRTERTLHHYSECLNLFFREVQKSPLDITSNDIKLFLAVKEVRDGINKTSQQNLLRVISSFYQWMVREEYIIKNPMNKVDVIKIPKKKKKAFSDMEVEIMRTSIKTLREKALFEVMLSTWCRVSEIEGMNISSIHGDSIEVLGKGQKVRKVYLNAKAKVALNEYLESRTDENEGLFVSVDKPHNRLLKSTIEKWLRELGRSLGIENVHPHRFRRTGATFALRKGMPIEQVSKLLGHESIETTQIYLDISEDEAADAHKKYV